MKTSIIKKLGNKILAAATGAAVFVSAYAPTLASAAEEVPLYISEVYLSYGETPDKAKQWLKDNGYTVLDQDLNEEADGLMSTKRSVYLGYKTTTDKDEAITDMRAMNMNGDYSFDDYERLLISKKAEINTFISNMKVALSEYRENYKKGAVKAQISHDRMNQALDDDCGFGGLGDLLLEPVREEMSEADYNKEPDKHVDLTTVIMQGNLDSVNALMSDLCLAADTSGNGWIARLKESGADRLYDRYEAEYPELSESKLSALIQSEYDDDARVLAQKLAELKESLEIYTNATVKAESEPEEIKKYFEEHPDLNFNDWSMAATVYVILSDIKYGSGTLLDLVNGDKYDFDNEDDRSTLYPILDVMSEGQRSLLSYVDLGELVIMGNLEGEGWTETQEKANAILKTTLPESVYAGIDRTAFQPGGIALTSQARAIQSATGSSYATKILGVSARTLEYVGAASTLIVLAAGICSFKYGNTQIVVKELKYREIASDPESMEKISSCLEDLNKSREELGAKIQEFMLNNGYSSFDSVTPDMHSFTNRIIVSALENKKRTYQLISLERKNGLTEELTYDMFIDEFESSDPAFAKAMKIYQRDSEVYENEANRQLAKAKPQVEKTFGVRSQALKTAGVVLCIAGALIAIGTAAVAVYDLYKYYNKDYAPIPDKIVHESTDGQGRFVYTLYNCTPCNRKAQGFASDGLGDNGDMNGDVGLQWLALYTTKDKAAGAAITADIIAQKGSNQFSVDKPAGIRLFGKNDIVNIVSTEYCYNDKLGGLYIVSGNEIINDAPTVIPEQPTDSSAPDSSTTDSSAAAAATESQSSDSSEKEAEAAGSVVGTGTMVASCAGSAALGALICFFIVRRKKVGEPVQG